METTATYDASKPIERQPDWNFAWVSPMDPRAPGTHMAALYLRVTGSSPKEISERLHIKRTTVSRILSHPPYRDYLEQQATAVFRSHYEAAIKLQLAHTTVAEELVRLATESEKEETRLKAIGMFMRLGLGQITRLNDSSNSGDSEEDLGLSEDEARFLAIEDGCMDVDVEEETL